MNLSEIKKHITISEGNIKIGDIPNISLPPHWSCGWNVLCQKDCYSMHSWKQYPSVRKAWYKNFRTWFEDEIQYILYIMSWLSKKNPKYFRWHVGGDIPTPSYFELINIIACTFPKTQFLVFTKKYKCILTAYRPEPNLKVILSAWPEMYIPTNHKFRIAWMQDGTENRIPDDAVECVGNCENCMYCFEDNDKDVVFKKH